MKLPTRLDEFMAGYAARRPLTVLTVYDAQMAGLLTEAGVDLLLVGDSLGMVVQGHNSTDQVRLSDMVYHTQAVRRGSPDLPIVSDLSFDTYRTDAEALTSSRHLIEAGADAVKLEGYFPGLVAGLTAAGIPVMGHLGLLPQTAREFRVQGKDPDQAEIIFQNALALEREGCFSLVLECIPAGLATRITQALSIPVIGIGAGVQTSGQVLVINDLLGISRGHKAKFVPTAYPSVGDVIVQLVQTFKKDVEAGHYPSDQETYH